MIALFGDDFVAALKKHAALKRLVQKKVDMILQSPVGPHHLPLLPDLPTKGRPRDRALS